MDPSNAMSYRPLGRLAELKAHNENNEAKAGDRVRIRECRPISKDKNFFVEVILERAEIV